MKILITGGRSEIAQAIITRLQQSNHQIMTTASSPDSLAELKSMYKNVQTEIWNMYDPSNISEGLCEFIKNGVDVIILNAAPTSSSTKRLHEFSHQEITDNVNAHIVANSILLKECLPKMMELKFGRILFISSIAAYGISRKSLYSSAKSGMEGLIKSLAVDYGEFNIFSNIVRPGFIKTARVEKIWKRSNFSEVFSDFIPARSLGSAHQVAEAIDPLISKTSYINGAVLDISGGLPMFRSEFLLNEMERRRSSDLKNE